MSKFPVIPKDLLDELNRTYPERTPEPEWTDREIWMRVGERRLLRHLNHVFQLQNENVLRDTNVLV